MVKKILCFHRVKHHFFKVLEQGCFMAYQRQRAGFSLSLTSKNTFSQQQSQKSTTIQKPLLNPRPCLKVLLPPSEQPLF